MLIAAVLCLPSVPVFACPFCTTLRPTLAQQIDRADVAVLGEIIEADAAALKLRVHHSLKGHDPAKSKSNITISRGSATEDHPLRVGTLLLALGNQKAGQRSARFVWTTFTLNEAGYGYVARLPGMKESVSDRLAFFARYLEHDEPLVADDAYLEFGHAPFDEVARLGARLPVDRLREWLADEAIPPERKGLYGLLLGLAAAAQHRDEVADEFWQWITTPASDFRGGFDGVLGGYLWLGKNEALERLEKRYLDDVRAAVGDLRHFMTALRVYHDYGASISRDDLLAVYRRFLNRPAVAAEAVADLMRWRDWGALDAVGSLFGRPGYDDAAIERAIIRYLLACPLPDAQRQVARLRKLVPERVAEAEKLEASADGQ
jgi:hypothetical protein